MLDNWRMTKDYYILTCTCGHVENWWNGDYIIDSIHLMRCPSCKHPWFKPIKDREFRIVMNGGKISVAEILGDV